jgi:hypothetical protein
VAQNLSEVKATVSWWSHNEEVTVYDAAELDRVFDEVIQSECKEYPIVIEIQANGFLLKMAVGLAESFVQISSDSGLSPYLVAVSDKNATDTFDFYFQGVHHTEIPRRNILPSALARELSRAFVVTGTIPESIEWEEL